MTIVRNFRRYPVTFSSIVLLSIYMLFFGSVLVSFHPGPTRIGAFAGPLTFMPLHAWGMWYLVLGAAKIVRLFLFEHMLWSNLIHFAVTLLVVAWATSFYAGPIGTGVPAYTLIAVLTIGLPFITPLASRYWMYRQLSLES